VILAGGGGTRLWPLSREYYPKQFLALGGDGSLLQQTLRRLDGFATKAGELIAPLIVCNEQHRFLVAEQARAAGREPRLIMLEPVARNTAPALTAAALAALETDADPILLMMPADHLIEDVGAFQAALSRAVVLAARDYIVAFGIVPDRPETGYGYIHGGAAIDPAATGGSAEPAPRALEAFVEKPDRDTAQRYLDSGDYLWNSGIFVMRASVWLRALERCRPDVLAAAKRAYAGGAGDGAFFRLEAEAFRACPADSVDYAVMEQLGGQAGVAGAVVPLTAGWSDVGSWAGLWEIADRDASGNVARGDVYALDSSDNLIMSHHRMVATLGCRDLVVVETADAVMVAPREKTQEVRKIVERLVQDGRDERLTHRRVYRPWGSYESLDAGERFQVKRIVVNPGHSLSLQMHHHRAEHWIVVRGTAKVTRGEEEFLLSENQSTYIPIGEKHRLHNPGAIPLEIIEVQSGSYLGEDDIVRFADAYDRHR
jgi:mannose-1-phosphate guanylyltransferase/mannose-6-phosphate isomerase